MSEKNDFSFMKTGFNLVDNSNIENEQNIISLVTLFAKNALETATQYVTHAERTEVTVTDIKKSLMLEVFLFMKRPNVVQKTDELKQQLFNNIEDELEYIECHLFRNKIDSEYYILSKLYNLICCDSIDNEYKTNVINDLYKLEIFNELYEVIINIYNNTNKDKYLLLRKCLRTIYDNIRNLIIKYNGF